MTIKYLRMKFYDREDELNTLKKNERIEPLK